MNASVFAAAQAISVAGDVHANVMAHLRFMQAAAEQDVKLLVFPELSLTGYELGLAAKLAILPNDSLLQPLRDLARELCLTTVVGMPIRLSTSEPVLIGALIFGADGSLGVYSKQHLHTGEEVVFAPGHGGPMLQMDLDQVALAVCADFTHACHAASAAGQGATVYAAGVLISKGGYEPDTTLLQSYARQHAMAVLMANHGGATGGWESAGRSAIWGPDGSLLAAAQGVGEALVIARRGDSGWAGKAMAL